MYKLPQHIVKNTSAFTQQDFCLSNHFLKLSLWQNVVTIAINLNPETDQVLNRDNKPNIVMMQTQNCPGLATILTCTRMTKMDCEYNTT
jgi:hypothetical protein